MERLPLLASLLLLLCVGSHGANNALPSNLIPQLFFLSIDIKKSFQD
jgi:hypothetical protein